METVRPDAYRWFMTDDQLTPLTRRTPLDPYSSSVPHLVGIVDTNTLLSSIDNDCRNEGWSSRLRRMTTSGATVLYAADHVLEEVYEHLPTIAEYSPVPLADLRARFEEYYLPALRFVTVSDVDAPDAQVLAITDPDDVPTGWLAKLISPCVVFSDDRHLKNPGFAPKRWLDAAEAAVHVAEGFEGQVVTVNVAALPIRGMFELISFSGRKIGISPGCLVPLFLAWAYSSFRSRIGVRQPPSLRASSSKPSAPNLPSMRRRNSEASSACVTLSCLHRHGQRSASRSRSRWRDRTSRYLPPRCTTWFKRTSRTNR